MPPGLRVDLETLNAARIDVQRIHSEFEQATARTDRLADSVGHAGLADRVQAFADNWDHRRTELADQLAVVRDHLRTVVDGFTQTDQQLAEAITQQESSYPPRTAVPV